MKNLESHVQQFHSIVTNLQAQVELLKIGSNYSHEVIVVVDRKLDSSLGSLEKRLDGIREEVGAQIREQLQGFMVMFTCQHQVSLSPDFPVRERTEPVLNGLGVQNADVGPSEVEVIPGGGGDQEME